MPVLDSCLSSVTLCAVRGRLQDIKSSNVLLTANGAVRLADVAFSRLQTHTFLSDVPLVGTFAW